MTSDEIKAILEVGNLGSMSFPQLAEELGITEDMNLQKFAQDLIKLGVAEVRWEPLKSSDQENKLLRTYLVLALEEDQKTQIVLNPYTALPLKAGSLEHIHWIAVELCQCLYYALKGRELWLEYQIVASQAISEMESILKSGVLGELSFAEFLKHGGGIYHTPASMAHRLGTRGISKVRWDTYPVTDTSTSQACLVATLPFSAFATPPSLPSEWLVISIITNIRRPNEHFTIVNGDDLELWLLYRF